MEKIAARNRDKMYKRKIFMFHSNKQKHILLINNKFMIEKVSLPPLLKQP
jgi:hypothetical protein